MSSTMAIGRSRKLVPPPLRCTAIVVTASRKYTQRCRHQKTPGSDYCGLHIAAMARGEAVRQIRDAGGVSEGRTR